MKADGSNSTQIPAETLITNLQELYKREKLKFDLTERERHRYRHGEEKSSNTAALEASTQPQLEDGARL